MDSVLIKKLPNGVGNYSYQLSLDGKISIGCYSSYEDAVTSFYFKGFTVELFNGERSICLARG